MPVPASPASSANFQSSTIPYALRITRYAFSALTLLLAALLRLYHLGTAALRGDEAFAVTFSQFPLSELFAGMARTEPNPPLYWLLLRGWMSIAGTSEFAVRLPSVLAGLLTVALTYRLAAALLPRPLQRRGAQIAALLAAINPFLIWHSQDARVYSLLAALVTAAFWLTLRAAGMTNIDSPKSRRHGVEASAGSLQRQTWWAFLPAALLWALALYAHYFAAFALACAGLAVLLSPQGRRRWRAGLAAGAALGVAYLPWALYAGPLLLTHTKDWISTISPLEGLWRTAAVFVGGTTLPSGPHVAAGVAGIVLAGAGLWLALRHKQLTLPLLAWGPPLLLGLLSLWRPAFDERYLIGSLPAALVLIALPLALYAPRLSLTGGRWSATLALAGLAGLAALSLSNYYWNPVYDKSPAWRELAAFLAEQTTPADLVLQDFQDPAFDYYYHGPAPALAAPHDTEPDQPAQLAALLQGHPRLWFFLSDATTGADDWLIAHAEPLADGRAYGFRLLIFDSPAASLAARTPFAASFDDGVRLVGYRLFLAPFPTAQASAGGRLHVTLYWQADAPVSRDYTVFTHFVAADGFRVTGHDSPPDLGRRPSTGWRPGEMIVDSHDLEIPAGLAPGTYSVRVGLYDPSTGQRLLMVDSGDDFVLLPETIELPR